MTKFLVGIALVAILAGLVYIAWPPPGVVNNRPMVRSFEECAGAGYPIMESYPRQCREPGGKTFTEDIGNELEKTDLIRVSTPRPNTKISSPLHVEGEARGIWFF